MMLKETNRIIIFCISTILLFSSSQLKSISTIPFITHYQKIDYDAGYQNWDIVQDSRGMIYFANNNGLLQFNNKSWRCYSLPNNTIIRSLALDSNDNIYAGGQNELGVYVHGDKGEMKYNSLKGLIPEGYRDFEDVWKVFIHPKYGVFFMTTNKLYQYKDGTISVFRAAGLFNYVGKMGKDVVVQDIRTGLNIFTEKGIQPIKGTKLLSHCPVTGIIDRKDGTYLITTLRNGIFISDGEYFEKWKESGLKGIQERRIYKSAVFKDGKIVLGTTLNGVYILDKNGNILQHISEENGLAESKILSVYVDYSENLWLGLDNGIDYLHTNSPFSRLSSNGIMDGAGYDIEFYDNKVFYGTSKSVFYSGNSFTADNYFKDLGIIKMDQVKGQVWGFNKVDNKLFLGHHEGGFIIDPPEINRISPSWGVWLFQKYIRNPQYLLAGTYTGISVYENKGGEWKYIRNLPGFNESSRFLEQDVQGNIWVSHPYKGVFKLTPDSLLEKVNVEKYGKANGLYSDLANYLFKIYGEIVFCSKKGVYSYNYEKDTFEIHNVYNDIFGYDNEVIRLFESASGNVYYVTSSEMGILEVTEKGISKEIKNNPFFGIKKLMVNGFETIYPLNDSNIFISSERGFIHLNPKKHVDTSFVDQVLFDEISVTSEMKECLFIGIPGNSEYRYLGYKNIKAPELTSKKNSLFFSFTSTDYSNPEYLEYRYYLEGLEKNWSTWIKKAEKEYTHLNAGEYTFHVQSKNQSGGLTPIASFHFIILPPWYLSKIAKLAYTFLVASVLFWIFMFLRSKYLKQKHKVLVTEEQLQKLKEEQLEKELNFKNRELVTASLHIGHKNTLLSKVEREIQKVVEKINDTDTSRHLRQIIKVIKSEDTTDKEIRQFSKLFNEVHPGFMDRMKAKYPDLSGNDLKMCSYIRMNMSTKEIAAITNMTIRGVEGRRYRLRKKLRLNPDVDLASFLLYF